MRPGLIVSALVLIMAVLMQPVRSEASEINMITIGSGDAYWSAYGHTAFQVGDQQVYGFGYFSFADEDFFLSFLLGKMRYFLGISDADGELYYAKVENRSYYTQKLTLNDSQEKYIIDELIRLEKPENRYYSYDYFLNNCSSKIRDILDQAVGGEMKSLFDKPSGSTYYQQTFPAANQAWMNLGIAIGYGLPAYEKKSQWELMVFPDYLMQALSSSKNPWVQNPKTLYLSDKKQNGFGLWLNTHWALLIVSAVLFLLFSFNKSRQAVSSTWLVVQSLIGLFLLFLWLMTEHSVAATNFNVLLFFPLAFLLFFKKQMLPIFLTATILWLIIAAYYGAYYLLPFMLFNLLIWKDRNSQV